MLFGSECIETCPNNTLNLVNLQCIPSESCEQENLKFWEDAKLEPSNGTCELVKYCDSIVINEELILDESLRDLGCQVVEGFVDFRFSFKHCFEKSDLSYRNFAFLSKIEVIRDYVRITNIPPNIRKLGILPKLKMVGGINLESGVNSLVFDFNTGLGSLQVTSQNNTVSNDAFCINNCDSGYLTHEITPKTFGFVVKMLSEELKNDLNDNVRLTSSVSYSADYYHREICEPSSITPP